MDDNIESRLIAKFGKIKKTRGRNGIDYIVRCFHCGRPKLYISAGHDMYHCFRCGKAGTVASLLGSRIRPVQTTITRPAELPTTVRPPGELVALTDLAHDHAAITYIRKRGYTPEELNDVFGVRYCQSGSVFGKIFNTTGTLVFPMWMQGKLIGWQARLLYTPDELSDDECALLGMVKDEDGDWIKPPKYFTSPGLEKGRAFFNYDNARASEIVVITEGPFDAIGVGRPAVATLGKGVTDNQAAIIKDYWKLAIIMLDPGDADLEMAELMIKLMAGIKVLRVALQGYKDPGEAPRDQIWIQIGAAAHAAGIDLFEFKITL